MPSILALRAVAAATLGLGVADLVVLNTVLGPRALVAPVPAIAASSPHVGPAPALAVREAPRETPTPLKTVFDERVYFPTMSHVLAGAARIALRELVARAGATATFTLEGHADIRGHERLNLSLSKQRAMAVADELARLGVERTRISLDFVGSANASPTGELWRDRRVDIRVVGERAVTELAIASFVGAVLFFVAGATAALLWRARKLVGTVGEPIIESIIEPIVPFDPDASVDLGARAQRPSEPPELSRSRLAHAPTPLVTATVAYDALRDHEVSFVAANGARHSLPDRVTSDGSEALRKRAETAERALAPLATELRTTRERAQRAEARLAPLTEQLDRLRDAANHAPELERLQRELAAARRTHQKELERLRAATAGPTTDELEHLRRELASARARADELAARSSADAEKLADLEARAKHLTAELEHARNVSISTTKDAEAIERRANEIEQQLAERTRAARDLVTENEQLKNRLADADALRAEYVRLRTSVTETAYLKAEVARLEEQIRTLKRDALGARPVRSRPTSEPPIRPTGSIGESLSTTLDRFADANTRATAIADALGFPLASTGEDGNALAAYAALLYDSASRASQLLPMAAPSAVELIDDRGARIGVWTFGVERDRLMLVNLAVAPVEPRRVQSALAELSTILAPTGPRTEEIAR